MIERLQELRVVPVVTLPDVESAVPLARALTAGGLPVAEITFRSEAAAAGIEAIRNAAPEVLVGAGTVLDVETVDRAVAAGAQFIVSPGLNEAVVGRARQLGVPIIPGAVTPTEVERAPMEIAPQEVPPAAMVGRGAEPPRRGWWSRFVRKDD